MVLLSVACVLLSVVVIFIWIALFMVFRVPIAPRSPEDGGGTTKSIVAGSGDRIGGDGPSTEFDAVSLRLCCGDLTDKKAH